MSMKPINITGAIRGKFDDKALLHAFNQAATTPLERIASKVQRSAKNSMRKGDRKNPSKPGKPPHRITGRLAGSIKWAKVHASRLRIQPNTIIVGPTGYGWYGKLHEWGTKKKIITGVVKVKGRKAKTEYTTEWKLPPRPFMRPALKNTKRTMARKFEKLPLLQTPAGAKLDAEMRAITRRGSKQWQEVSVK